jgi:predicted aminopeptidase
MRVFFPGGYAFFPALAAVLLLFLGAILFSGCYTLKQGVAMLGYLGRAVPLESLLTSGASGESRRFAERVEDIRRFAMEELGLRESANYTKYVDLDREYLAAVVSASAKDSFDRYQWWFPVVGHVPYKGFFNVKDARREEERLKKRDKDVWIRGVDAFSTLGWFQDPLYSYMRDYPVHRLADLIIHELLHATVFLRGQAQFNEELAEFVGTEGARLYVEKTFGLDSQEYRAMAVSEKDGAAFLSVIRGLIGELETLYGSPAEREEKLLRKEAIIREAQERFEADYEKLFQNDSYRGFSTLPVNNAYLELYRLYYAEDAYFKELYERSGRDLPKFIAAAKTLSLRAGDPKTQLERALGLE